MKSIQTKFKMLFFYLVLLCASFLIPVCPALALNWQVLPPVHSLTCTKAVGESSYPGNGKLFYCAKDTSDRTAVYSKLYLEPVSTVKSILSNGDVEVWVWDTWYQYKQYYNVPTLPSGYPETSTYGFTTLLGVARKINVVRKLQQGTVTIAATDRLLGSMMHEVGHQFDVLWVSPVGNVFNSQVSTSSIYYQKLLKDKAKINTYRPCVSLFLFDRLNGQAICVGGNLIPSLSGKSNWEILQLIYGYYTTVRTFSAIPTYAETFAETYSVLSSAGQVPSSVGAIDKYLKSDAFACSRHYINGMRTNGVPPTTGYRSWCQ